MQMRGSWGSRQGHSVHDAIAQPSAVLRITGSIGAA